MQEKPTNNEFLKLQYLEVAKRGSTTNANSNIKMRKNKPEAPQDSPDPLIEIKLN